MPDHELLTVGEVAELLRISKARVYQLRESGALRPVQFVPGGQLLFSRSAIQQRLEKGLVTVEEDTEKQANVD